MLFPRINTYPLGARQEIFNLFTYTKFLPGLFQYKTMTIPDFESIDGKPFKDICNGNPKFQNYCSLLSSSLDIGAIFKLMKYATHPGQYSNKSLAMNYGTFAKDASPDNHDVSFTPLCWFAQNVSVLNSPEADVGMINFFPNRQMMVTDALNYYKVIDSSQVMSLAELTCELDIKEL